MNNVVLARLAQLPLVLVQIGYAYFFVKRVCFSVPRRSRRWLVGWTGMMGLALMAMFGQDFIYRSIAGCGCAHDDPILSFLAGIAGAWISIVMIYQAKRRRQSAKGQ